MSDLSSELLDVQAVIEIRDPLVDANDVLGRVMEGVRQREAHGAYGPDPGLLGPDALCPAATDEDRLEPCLDLHALHLALADLSSRARLHPFAFTSRLPLLGRFIVALRSFWSSMAARWIEQHLIVEQGAFNSAAAAFGREMVRWQDANLRHVQQLQGKIHALEGRLAVLEARESCARQEEDPERER